MIDIVTSFNKPLNASSIKKYLDKTNHGNGKYSLISKYIRSEWCFFHGNLNVKDTHLNVNVKELLEMWAANLEHEIQTFI